MSTFSRRFPPAAFLMLTASLAFAEQYGAPITRKDPVTIEAAVKQLGEKPAADVLLQSKVDKVCEQAGCWIGLKSAKGDLHVTFKDEAFVVPMSLMGKRVLAQGKLSRVALTLDETREKARQEGRDPASVKTPGVRYEFVASGIEVQT